MHFKGYKFRYTVNFYKPIIIFISLAVLTGIVYPVLVTILAQLVWPYEANGSLLLKDGKPVGSALIGQMFTDNKYIWGRPSSTDYKAFPSGASNLGPTNQKLRTQVVERRNHFKEAHDLSADSQVPYEMLFTSGSGLDPHISLAAVQVQLSRVIAARKWRGNPVKANALQELIDQSTEKPFIDLFGQSRVNVLLLNYRIDQLSQQKVNHE